MEMKNYIDTLMDADLSVEDAARLSIIMDLRTARLCYERAGGDNTACRRSLREELRIGPEVASRYLTVGRLLSKHKIYHAAIEAQVNSSGIEFLWKKTTPLARYTDRVQLLRRTLRAAIASSDTTRRHLRNIILTFLEEMLDQGAPRKERRTTAYMGTPRRDGSVRVSMELAKEDAYIVEELVVSRARHNHRGKKEEFPVALGSAFMEAITQGTGRGQPMLIAAATLNQLARIHHNLPMHGSSQLVALRTELGNIIGSYKDQVPLLKTAIFSDDGTHVLGIEKLRFGTPLHKLIFTLMFNGCEEKGCEVPPNQCDLHHIQAAALGGTVSYENLAMLCVAHHAMQSNIPQYGRFHRDTHTMVGVHEHSDGTRHKNSGTRYWHSISETLKREEAHEDNSAARYIASLARTLGAYEKSIATDSPSSGSKKP